MFALEIDFLDNVSQPEVILVRRPLAIIGGTDHAHVVIEDLAPLEYELRMARQLGRSFRCTPIALGSEQSVPPILEGVYAGHATLDLGSLQLHATALDLDLMLKGNETPDKAGLRVLRQACVAQSPLFPAVVVLGEPPIVVSFVADQPLYIGRSKSCFLRLDSASISSMHARLEFESGTFWIEDLGSTNGTFVGQQQVGGRVAVSPGELILLAGEIPIMGATNEQQVKQALKSAAGEQPKRLQEQQQKYPALIAVSEVARPARLVLSPGVSVNIGRDPASDLWLGAPHVSRKHCSVSLAKTGTLTVTDHSMNGTVYDDGTLHNGDLLELRHDPKVLDFGAGVTVAICFSEEQEDRFKSAAGAADVFRPADKRAMSRADLLEAGVARAHALALGGNVAAHRLLQLELLDFFRNLGPLGKMAFLLTGGAVVFVVTLVFYVLIGVSP